MELPVPHKEFKASGILAQHVVLKSINIMSGSFSVEGEFDSPGLMNTDQLKYSPWGIKFEFNEKSNELLVYTTFKLKGELDEKASFVIHAIIKALYQLDTTPPPEELRKLFFGSFAKYNCLMHVWPYWREYVASVSQRMGLPLWIEPALHFKLKANPINKKQQKIEKNNDK